MTPVALLCGEHCRWTQSRRVLLVDPAAIVSESPHGLNDLYVAITRTTHRLRIVHPGDLLPVLFTLQP